jgi:hypothetical protein
MGGGPDLDRFPTDALALATFAEIRCQATSAIFSLACKTVTVTQYIIRIQILIQFFDELANAARTTHNHHSIVLRGISGKKAQVFNRLLEPYGTRFSINDGWRNNTVWMRLSGAEPEVSLAERETAVRLETRHLVHGRVGGHVVPGSLLP